MAAIPRNAVFRRREVRIRPSEPLFQLEFPDFVLTEVSAVRLSSGADTAIVAGAIKPILQGWYFKPFTIEIIGKSYIGAFSEAFVPINVGVDDDIKKLLKLRELIDRSFITTGEENKIALFVDYFDPDASSADTHINQSFLAFFDSISIEENESLPFMKNYTLRFTGQFSEAAATSSGASDAQTDLESIGKFVSDQVRKAINGISSGIKKITLPSTKALPKRRIIIPKPKFLPRTLEFKK